jgi:bifunctional NMN adenylyltransferase/nudix hydrolase
MTKRYKLAILIGRFEPAHNGHFRNFAHASQIAEQVHILIGSSFQPRTIKNPFTATERQKMIIDGFHLLPNSTCTSYNTRFSFLKDYKYNDNLWISEVQRTVKEAHPNIADEDIVILGHDKDESSWYLRAFPTWTFEPLAGFVEMGTHPIDASKIRELLFEGHLDYIKGAVPASVIQFLKEFSLTPEYATLVEEYQFIKKYKDAWAVAPYAPTFFTVDAVLIQGGHILLVKRKFAPGKGLWALPGGFLNQNETAIQAVLRELKEETRIKIPLPVLQGSITYERLFDRPDRSLRGRTLTQAFLIELNGGETKLPKVKGSDDAAECVWFPINQALAMSEQLFEDHHSIIQTMVGRAK